jgi:threonine synthase
MAVSINTEQTLAAIKHAYEQHGYVLDPHSAVGYAAAGIFAQKVDTPIVCVATAHPAKFPDAVQQAVPGVNPRHPTLDALSGLEQRKQVINASLEAVKSVVTSGVKQ